MRTPLALVFALAAVLLSGCYVSNSLYLDPSEAEAPLATGVYSRPTPRGDEVKRVTREPDGWYLVEVVDQDGTIGDSYRVLFNSLDTNDGRHAYAFASLDRDQDFFYGVLVMDHGAASFATPDCASDVDRDPALDEGATADEDTASPTCRFHDPDSLKRALAGFADRADFGEPFHLK